MTVLGIRCAKHHQMSQLAWWLAWLLWHFCSYLVMWVCTSHNQHQIESLWSVTGELEYSWTLPFCTSIPSNHHSQKSLCLNSKWVGINRTMTCEVKSVVFLAVLESGFKEYCSIILREAVPFHYLCGKLLTVVLLRGSSKNETNKNFKTRSKTKDGYIIPVSVSVQAEEIFPSAPGINPWQQACCLPL